MHYENITNFLVVVVSYSTGGGDKSFTYYCNSEQLTTIFRSKYLPSDNPLATYKG